MNPRYFITTNSPTADEEGRIPLNSRGREPSRTPLLIRLAIKVSRSRWYSLLRRIFHYQNGSGSDLGPNPFDSKKWMLMEFMALVVQISSTVYTLVISKGERPVWPMRIWVSGYAFGCFLSLILLICRYCRVYLNQEDDVEQQRTPPAEESSCRPMMRKLQASLELLFAIWFVMGNVWVFDARFGSSYRRAPNLHILCISLLAWNAVTYSFPFILFVLLCCCVPLLSTILGYNMNSASISRGATKQQLSNLLSWRYKDVGHEISECCICLAKYKDKEEIRQLPCTHIFHLNCVDQWLKMISCCPLCKQGIQK